MDDSLSHALDTQDPIDVHITVSPTTVQCAVDGDIIYHDIYHRIAQADSLTFGVNVENPQTVDYPVASDLSVWYASDGNFKMIVQ